MEFDIFGGKKNRKRWTLSQNREKGKLAEAMFEIGERASGNKVERTGRGHDYKVTRPSNPLFGTRTKTEYVEVKSSRTAPVSELQKKTKKKMKGKYKVVRPHF